MPLDVKAEDEALFEPSDAEVASDLAVQVAAREIRRLSEKEALGGWDGADLERYAGIALRADNHRLTWMAKFEPEKLSDELLRRLTKGASRGLPARRQRSTDG